MDTPNLTDIINDVHGFISLDEMTLLYELASQVPSGGYIVEIGAYQGRSTIALALGAKVNGALVWSIDPHNSYKDGDTEYGMSDAQRYYENIADYSVGDVVKTINLNSAIAYRAWNKSDDIALLFIDGKHEYEHVYMDFMEWSHLILAGKVLFHDTAGHHPGVTRLVDEILAAGQWTITQRVDAIAVFERVK